MSDDVTMEIDGHVVDVIPGPYVHDGKPTAAAREFAAKLIGQLGEMRRYAAGELLDLYNDTWREGEDPELDEDEFCSRLTNPSITLYDEAGSAAVYFDTSAMFSDHAIEVWIDGGEIASASMVG
ncbi:MAG TPA: DUF2262 domain-containing protein [Longimicrobium sp.]|nr:DUF2262 domain-containing protein [Longimicrobium sp.]